MADAIEEDLIALILLVASPRRDERGDLWRKRMIFLQMCAGAERRLPSRRQVRFPGSLRRCVLPAEEQCKDGPSDVAFAECPKVSRDTPTSASVSASASASKARAFQLAIVSPTCASVLKIDHRATVGLRDAEYLRDLEAAAARLICGTRTSHWQRGLAHRQPALEKTKPNRCLIGRMARSDAIPAAITLDFRPIFAKVRMK
jgi:hypothetical protein